MFRESVAPWERENIYDSSTLKPNQNPFDYIPEKKSEVSLKFVHLFGTITVVSFIECIKTLRLSFLDYFLLIIIFFDSTIFRWRMELFRFMQTKMVIGNCYIAVLAYLSGYMANLTDLIHFALTLPIPAFVSSAIEKLYPVADATTFFTDLHYILKVIAAGNIRTLCHHRLVLLEQVNTFSFYIFGYCY